MCSEVWQGSYFNDCGDLALYSDALWNGALCGETPLATTAAEKATESLMEIDAQNHESEIVLRASIDCADESETSPWGLIPAGEGCWVDGFDLSACEGFDHFECRDGKVYDSNGNVVGSEIVGQVDTVNEDQERNPSQSHIEDNAWDFVSTVSIDTGLYSSDCSEVLSGSRSPTCSDGFDFDRLFVRDSNYSDRLSKDLKVYDRIFIDFELDQANDRETIPVLFASPDTVDTASDISSPLCQRHLTGDLNVCGMKLAALHDDSETQSTVHWPDFTELRSA